MKAIFYTVIQKLQVKELSIKYVQRVPSCKSYFFENGSPITNSITQHDILLSSAARGNMVQCGKDRCQESADLGLTTAGKPCKCLQQQFHCLENEGNKEISNTSYEDEI